MSNTNKLPLATAAISIVHLPTVTATNRCPHCDALNVDYIQEIESDKTVLTSCTACGKDYELYLPDFKIVKNKIICN